MVHCTSATTRRLITAHRSGFTVSTVAVELRPNEHFGVMLPEAAFFVQPGLEISPKLSLYSFTVKATPVFAGYWAHWVTLYTSMTPPNAQFHTCPSLGVLLRVVFLPLAWFSVTTFHVEQDFDPAFAVGTNGSQDRIAGRHLDQSTEVGNTGDAAVPTGNRPIIAAACAAPAKLEHWLHYAYHVIEILEAREEEECLAASWKRVPEAS